MQEAKEACRHIFTGSGSGATCARCGQSMIGVQISTQRPTPREELQNKLRELDVAEGKPPAPELPAPPTHSMTRGELNQAIANATRGLVTEAAHEARVSEAEQRFAGMLREAEQRFAGMLRETENALRAYIERQRVQTSPPRQAEDPPAETVLE